jgi:hypothetical protein
LSSNFIQLDEEKIDTLIWERNEKLGKFTTNLGYRLKALRELEGKNKWCWSFISGLNASTKMKIFGWIVLKDKVIT